MYWLKVLAKRCHYTRTTPLRTVIYSRPSNYIKGHQSHSFASYSGSGRSQSRNDDASDAKNDRIFVSCPYETGTRMKLLFIAEGSEHALPIDVTILKSFQPFTISQCLLVHITSPLVPSCLPASCVIKLVDPRFSRSNSTMGLNRGGWTHSCDAAFQAGLQKIRDGVWRPYWRELGAPRYIRPAFRDLPLHPCSEAERFREDFVNETEFWVNYRSTLAVEVEAYRRLRRLQGNGIPRLYGTCRYISDDGSSELDPFMAEVPGLVIEYIDGLSLDKLLIDQDLPENEMERVAQGAMTVARRIRDNLVIHDDLVARNIIVRQDDIDHPVIIDFGSACLAQDAGWELFDLDKWIDNVAHGEEPDAVRKVFAKSNLRNPSPIPEYMHDITHHEWIKDTGYGAANRHVESIRRDWRDRNYERIPDSPPDVVMVGPNGEAYVWEHLKWRIRPDANTTNASADYIWGKKKYGHVPPWSWS